MSRNASATPSRRKRRPQASPSPAPAQEPAAKSSPGAAPPTTNPSQTTTADARPAAAGPTRPTSSATTFRTGRRGPGLHCCRRSSPDRAAGPMRPTVVTASSQNRAPGPDLLRTIPGAQLVDCRRCTAHAPPRSWLPPNPSPLPQHQARDGGPLQIQQGPALVRCACDPHGQRMAQAAAIPASLPAPHSRGAPPSRPTRQIRALPRAARSVASPAQPSFAALRAPPRARTDRKSVV